MKVAGIISEYNPFHNGHAYHIEEVRKRTGADYVVAVMSGNFVQRGEPAICNKYIRARMALLQGADLVVELPVVAATASAETFARTGVAILKAMGVVTHIGFGCECEDLELLETVADLFVKEPEDYRNLMADHMRTGMSFPAARAQAACDVLGDEAYFHILNNPNNILAIEYLKAIKQLNAPLIPCPILRKGSGYHEDQLKESFASATGIRKGIEEWMQDSPQQEYDSKTDSRILQEFLEDYIPAESASVLAQALEEGSPIFADDFSPLLQYKLQLQRGSFEEYADLKAELSNRIEKLRENFQEYSTFAMELKTKNITYTSVSRGLIHILLDIRQEDMDNLAEEAYAPYIRVLGFKKSASPLLKEIQNASVPVLTKLAQDEKWLSESAKHILDIDIRSANLYNDVVARKAKATVKNSEYRTPLIYM